MKFYCTFGSGQELSGYAVPIDAPHMRIAMEYMTEHYGRNWSCTYSEEEWKAIPIDIREIELRPIDLTGQETLYDRSMRIAEVCAKWETTVNQLKGE